MKPYYEHGEITIYHGDCREFLPTLAPGSIDLILTDPPYGISKSWKGGFSALHGWSKAATQKELRNTWDANPPSIETLSLILSLSTNSVIWGGKRYCEVAAKRMAQEVLAFE